jgi:hypothetical protein
MFIYYKDKKLMYSFGPYGKYHSTAATFAFRRELLEITEFNENDCLSEEKFFLKNYTIPLIQLNPLLSILVFRHIHNSFDKNELLNPNINSLSCLREDVKVEDFIKDNELKKFYSEEIDNYLLPYKCGEIKNKPDILNHIKITNEKRKQQCGTIGLGGSKTLASERAAGQGDSFAYCSCSNPKGPDCGCAWGDFLCICVVYWDCDCNGPCGEIY